MYGSGATDLQLATPKIYKGVKYDKGTNKSQVVSKHNSLHNKLDEIEDGSFSPWPNWTYFWFCSIKYLSKGEIFGRTYSTTNARYVGTSLSPLSSEAITLVSASHMHQRVYEDTETELGYGYLGSAPYLEVSGPNGVFTPQDRWEDRDWGVYNVRDDGYNNLSIIAKIASLEYDKLKNINGDILPITSGNLTLTVDAYLHYGLKLLTRLNLLNTTVANTYNKNNGFPVAIKGITISSGTMQVSLTVDNQLSQNELDEIDAKIPSEPNVIPGKARKTYHKWNVAGRKYEY